MLMLISPAKSLDFSKPENGEISTPRMLEDSERLAKVLRKKSARSIKNLMHVSDQIAELNYQRFQTWTANGKGSKSSIHVFNGDVYRGLEAHTFNKRDINFAQKHLRILSGLYGLLRPLDQIQPYRLEMGSRLTVGKHKTLYSFWDNRITEMVNADLKEQGDDIILNLASNEYFKSVKPKALDGRLVHAQFKELRKGVYKVVSFSAKKARGQMSNFIIKNRIKKLEDILSFEAEGYGFNKELSTEDTFVFTRVFEG